MDQNQPLTTLRDGRLKAVIWENQNEAGEPYHNITLAKTYEDKDGRLQDTNSFSASELLKVGELAREAHGVIRGIRRDLAIERQHDERPEQHRDQRPEPRAAQHREDRPARFRKSSQPGLER